MRLVDVREVAGGPVSASAVHAHLAAEPCGQQPIRGRARGRHLAGHRHHDALSRRLGSGEQQPGFALGGQHRAGGDVTYAPAAVTDDADGSDGGSLQRLALRGLHGIATQRADPTPDVHLESVGRAQR